MKRKFRMSESLKNVTKISGGTALGQIISIGTLPFITRIYGAEILGIWTTINALSNIITNVSDLGMTNALMMCEEKKLSWLYGLIVKIAVLLSLIGGCVVFVYQKIMGSSSGEAFMICFFVTMYAVSLGGVRIGSVILNRDKQYNVLMKNSVLRFSVVAVVSIFLGLLGWKAYGYFVANIIGQLITILHMGRAMPKMELFHKVSDTVVALKEHKNYIRYQMPAGAAVTLRTELPNLLIGTLFGNTMLGYYSISQKLLTIPVTFLGQSLGKVFFQRAAEMKRNGQEVGAFVEKNINRGMIIALIPMTLLAAYGDAAVVLYFGSEYYIGGVICRIIAFRAVFNFISTTAQGIDVVIDKQQYVFYTCLMQTITAAISVVMGYYMFDSIYATAVLMVGSFIVIQIVYFVNMYKAMGLSRMRYLRNMFCMIMAMLILSLALREMLLAILQVIPFEPIHHLLQYFVI